jgi:hypothetical protein
VNKSANPIPGIAAGLLLFFAAARMAYPQDGTVVNPAQFLFSEFTRSQVAVKSGRNLNLMLNYNIVTEKMVFMQKGEVYDMVDYSNVDTVYIQHRKFIPSGKVFREVAVEGPVVLLIQHKGSIQAPPRPAAYGGTSEVSSSTYINNMKLGNEVYRLKTDPTLIIKPEPEFLIVKGTAEPRRFMNEKQLISALPEYKDVIKQFVKKYRIKFDRLPDVIRLAEHCNKTVR